MKLSAGIVGLPNVGKSTLFNALTRAAAAAENFPFCTIEPNVGIVPVPDARLTMLARHIDSAAVVPASVELVDIAGLVKGASEGEGLGNQFLGNIREVDAIVQVVRCFTDDHLPNPVAHVHGGIDPVGDAEVVETELLLADLQSLERRLDKVRKAAKGHDKTEVKRLAVTERLHDLLAGGRWAREASFNAEEQVFADEAHLLTVKPVLYLANVADDDLHGESEPVSRLRELASQRGSQLVALCASLEAELIELSAEERLEMLDGLGLDEPALDVLVRAIYKQLGLRTFFTANENQITAWAIPAGTTAREAAGTVHSDFADKFVRAEVFQVDLLDELGGEAGIRAAGQLRVEGRDYEVQDGDVLFIRHS